MIITIEKKEQEMLANLSAYNDICKNGHQCQLNELASTRKVIKLHAKTLSNQMVDFAKEKHTLEEHAGTIFNERAAKLQKMSEKNKESIQQATTVFDQKIKDKMIDMERIHQKVKNIQVTIHDGINENKVFQNNLKDSVSKAKETCEHLMKAIKDFIPL